MSGVLLADRYMSPMTEGDLDEVAAEHRKACVDAINQFRREHGLLPIVVCSRTADTKHSVRSYGCGLRSRFSHT